MKVLLQWRSVAAGAEEAESGGAPQPRTAILGRGYFPVAANAKEFSEGWSPELLAYAPEALVAPARTLKWLAAAVCAKKVLLPSVKDRVVAVEGGDFGWLTEEDRRAIRRAWSAPLFELRHAAAAATARG
jgi:hypothetical protein